MRASLLAVLCLASLLPVVTTCGGDSTGPQVPAALSQISGNGQSGTVGQALANPLVVKVVDASGGGVPGVTVAWSVTSGGGTVSAASTTSDTLGVTSVSWTMGFTAGTSVVAASVAGVPTITAVTYAATALPGQPTTLAFSVQPSAVVAGTAISPPPQVSVLDAHGNTTTNAVSTVAVAITSGTGTAGAVLGGTLAQATVHGVAISADLTIDKAGTGYTLTATSPGLTAATSSAFSVNPGAAARLAFTVQPGNATAGTAIAPAVQVAVQDALGNTVTSATSSITLAITSGTGSMGATLGGTVTQAAVNGVAAFNNLVLTLWATEYKLTATASGLTSAVSTAFGVSAAAPARLAFVRQPVGALGGAWFTTAVEVMDTYGNRELSTANIIISMSITSETGIAGAALSGTTAVSMNSGYADFMNLYIDKVGAGYTLTATSPGLTSATSTPFNVVLGPPAAIAFTGQPSTSSTSAPISPAVQVTLQDAGGNVVTTPATNVTVLITDGTGTAGAVLGGTRTRATVSGVATFGDLTIDKAGTGYTLTAGTASIPNATSSPFTVWANYALDFTQSYVSVADNDALDLGTTWTLEAWVYPTQASTGTNQDVISKWGGGGNASYGMQIGPTGRVYVGTHDGTVSRGVMGRTALTNGTWQHIAATFDQGTIRIYINGVLDTTQAGFATPMNSTSELAFGREGSYASYTFAGAIDDIRIWNVARSGADIATYRSIRMAGNETGLAGNWRLDEGTGDVASDATGRGNHGRLGTAVGADTWDPRWTTNAAPIR